MMNNWCNITDKEFALFKQILNIPPGCMCRCLRGARFAVKIKEDHAIDIQENLEIHINILHTQTEETPRAYIFGN